MANKSENHFGFELLFNISGTQITKKEDVLILFVHWYFIKNKFKCLGTGDSKTIDPRETGSELLPTAWSQSSNYKLRYIREDKLYILIGIKSESDLILNLLRVEDHKVTNVKFAVDVVKELKGHLQCLIPTYEVIFNAIKKDLVEPLYLQSGREVSTQTSTTETERLERNDDDPLRVGLPQRPADSVIPGRLSRDGLFALGQDDLDPFHQGRGGGGGGMLFDPFSNPQSRFPHPGLGIPGRLPHGSVPPHARFDPFGPPDFNNPQPRMPDADHLPPPGYDDMFM